MPLIENVMSLRTFSMMLSFADSQDNCRVKLIWSGWHLYRFTQFFLVGYIMLYSIVNLLSLYFSLTKVLLNSLLEAISAVVLVIKANVEVYLITIIIDLYLFS